MSGIEEVQVGAGPVGRSAPRRDAAEKLRGEAQFVGDIIVPRMLHGKVLRSPLPHARIPSIDTSAARGDARRRRVLTGADLMDLDPYWGHAIKDRPIVAIDRVRLAGEPVAAVAADDEATAEAAIVRIVVELRGAAVVGTIEEALAPDAPLVHEGPIRPGLFHGLGSWPPSATATSATAIASTTATSSASSRTPTSSSRATTRFPGVYQYAMETHTVVAQVEAGDITLWATCQHPFLVRAEIAAPLRPAALARPRHRALPRRRLRQQVVHEDGAHHGRPRPQGRPAGAHREPRRRVDGHDAPPRRAAACARRPTARAGCWPRRRRLDSTPAPTPTTGRGSWPPAATRPRARTAGPACRCDAACVHTNTAPSGSYRAFGASHLQWVGELQVDEVGPPRRARSARDPPHEPAAAGEEVRRGRQAARRRPRRRRRAGGRAHRLGRAASRRDTGRGLSVGLLAAGAHPVSSAIVRLEADGEAVVLVGSTEMGQGQRTAFAQIAAEVLRLPAERVRCGHGHAVHALRPLDRCQPLDDAGRPRRPAGGARSGRLLAIASHLARRDRRLRGAAWCEAELPTRSSSPGASGSPAGSSSARAASTRRAPAPTPRGPSSGRSASAAAEVASTRTPGACES